MAAVMPKRLTPIQQAISQRPIFGLHKKRLGKPTKILYPKNFEGLYNRLLLIIVKNFQDLVTKLIIPQLSQLHAQQKALLPDDSNLHIDAVADNIATLFNTISLTSSTFLNNANLQGKMLNFAGAIAGFNRQQVTRALKSILGVDIYTPEPWLNDSITNFVHQNTALIKSLQSQSLSDLQGIVMRGFQQGVRPEDIAEQLKARYGVQQRRANLIARDQVGKLNGQLNKLRQQGAGVESYIWRTSEDERVRGDPDGLYPNAVPSHFIRDGVEFRWDSPPEDGHPGESINCLIGETKVFSLVYCKKFFRRFYKGEMTKLITSSGESIIATPNHPILTNRGWLPIKDVKMQDNLISISNQGLEIFKRNNQYFKPTIEEIFNFLSIIFGVNFAGGTANQFHGDGIINEQVNIIDIDSCLLNDFKIDGFTKNLCEDVFSFANMALSDFPSDSSIMYMLYALGFSSYSCVCLFSKLFSLGFGQFAHSDDICLRAITELNTVFNKTNFDTTSGDSVFFRKPQNALTRDILFDNIFFRKLLAVMRRTFPVHNCESLLAHCDRKRIGITRESFGNFMQIDSRLHETIRVIDKSFCVFSGHVYNLENYYESYIIADNTLTGNCRCSAEPVIKS